MWPDTLPNITSEVNLIGCGHYGNVYRGKSKTNRDVAIKTIKNQQLQKAEFTHEALLLSLCNHNNIIILVDICFHLKPCWIMLEFMENGNIKDFLTKNDSVSPSTLIRMAQQVSNGMVYLSTKLLIIHRDLAARNILLDSHLQPKISDFGLARQLAIGQEYYGPDHFNLPLRWSAPEVVINHIYSFKSDVWAFGIVLFEIASRGQMPFGDNQSIEIGRSIILKDSRHFSMLADLPDHCWLVRLMHSCWEKQEKERPTFTKIYNQLTSMIPVTTSDGIYTYSTSLKMDHSANTSPRQKPPCPGYLSCTCIGTSKNRKYVKKHPDEMENITEADITKWTSRLQIPIRPKSDFAISSWISSGHFSDIFHAEMNNGTDVAMKSVRHERQTLDEFLHEAEIMTKLNHQHVISIVALCFKPLFIVTEYMENDNLRKFLIKKKTDGNPLSEEVLTGIAQQVANGMTHVSHLRIIHRDLAARNVLVGAYRKGCVPLVKIADFGLSHRLGPDEKYKPPGPSVLLALYWSAPEVITDKIFSTKSDVWAFGMLLYEILSHGQISFGGLDKRKIVNLIVHQPMSKFPMLSNQTASGISKIPESLRRIMTSCWNKEMENRPSFEAIHKYLTEEGTHHLMELLPVSH